MMGKYNTYTRREMAPAKRDVHPIWRGIGFILIILTPIMAYACALVLIDENTKQGWVRISRDMLSPYLDPLLYVKIGLTLGLMVIIYGIFSMLTFVLYRFMGPPRYGPLDVPPVSYRGKTYKR
jgi:hypothetical protein